ncbi:hypothetical protein EBT31_06190 [bacterium]|nr:hypothetical protein [bacterium]
MAVHIREQCRDKTVVLGCSGGKDSTACGLFLQEVGIPFTAIFCDTGWEHPKTYQYLREVLGPLFGGIQWLTPKVEWHKKVRTADGMSAEAAAELATRLETYAQEFEARLGVPYSAFVRSCLKKGGFPARTLRWCTEQLKTEPAAEYIANLDNPIQIVGIRHEESKARSAMPRTEWDNALDCEVLRPIIDWLLDDVIIIHKDHGVQPNPLYLSNASRVGCFPCIYSRKAEIASLDEARIGVIRDLERVVGALFEERIRRRGDVPERVGPSFFQDDQKNETGTYTILIDDVVGWARTPTKRERFTAPKAQDGCMRWGRCDTGSSDTGMEDP